MTKNYFSGETYKSNKTAKEIIAEIAERDRSVFGSASRGFTYTVVESAPVLKIEREHIPTDAKLGTRPQFHLITVTNA